MAANLTAVAGMALLAIVISLVTFIARLLTARQPAAIVIGAAVAAGAWGLNAVALLVPQLASFRYASLVYYAQDALPATGGVPIGHLLILLGCAGLLAITSILLARAGPARANRAWRLAPRRRTFGLTAGLAALLGSAIAFALVTDEVRDRETTAIDTAMTSWLHGLASPTLDLAMNTLSALGSAPVVALLVVVTVAVLMRQRRRREVAFLAAAIGGSVVLNEMLKIVVHRARPVLPWGPITSDYSFPSGHSMSSLVFYLAVAVVVGLTCGRRVGAVAGVGAVLLAAAIGVSRVYLGYHYASDVIAGYLAGAAWLLFIGAVFAAWDRTADDPMVPPGGAQLTS